MTTMDTKTTQEIRITDAMLDAVYPRERLARRSDDRATPAELICDAIDVASIRASLADTVELPAYTEVR